MKTIHRILLLAVLFGSWATHVAALTNQVVLFTGFLSGAGPETGMGILNTTLQNFGIPDYQGMVFEWNDYQGAFDWVQQTGNRTTLVLIGHSFGANSALQLANDFLKPLEIDVDLTIQIDSFDNGGSTADNVLPTNVDVGFNYYQAAGFFDLHGEQSVQGATNINVEVLFNDTSITHTSIDDDPRLHALIGQNIFDNLNQPSPDFDLDGDVDGADFLAWQRDPSVGSLSDWQATYGTAPLSGAITAVPEPSGLVLLFGLMIVGANTRLSIRRNTFYIASVFDSRSLR